jgi:hypothetical protein
MIKYDELEFLDFMMTKILKTKTNKIEGMNIINHTPYN